MTTYRDPRGERADRGDRLRRGRAGAVAWLTTTRRRCDLVIIDIFLEHGNGLGVLKGLASSSDSTRRVVLTNHATPEIRAKCAELGAERVFDKSNEIDEMLRWFNRIGGVEAEVGYDA